MPEIAEVEFARRQLTSWTCGKSLIRVDTKDSKNVMGAAEFHPPSTVIEWQRQGKMLFGTLENKQGILSHLGMTGKWVHNPSSDRRHNRLELFFSDGSSVALIDPRRFGWSAFGGIDAMRGHSRWSDLGPDCLDEKWSGERLKEACGSSKQTLKDRLMNQKVIAGLGNIALVEMGFRARLHPHRSCASLQANEWDDLARAMDDHIRYVLDVEDGEEIHYQSEKKSENPFLCYGRKSEPCPNCTDSFARDVLKGRPTYYCPSCQPR